MIGFGSHVGPFLGVPWCYVFFYQSKKIHNVATMNRVLLNREQNRCMFEVRWRAELLTYNTERCREARAPSDEAKVMSTDRS